MRAPSLVAALALLLVAARAHAQDSEAPPPVMGAPTVQLAPGVTPIVQTGPGVTPIVQTGPGVTPIVQTGPGVTPIVQPSPGVTPVAQPVVQPLTPAPAPAPAPTPAQPLAPATFRYEAFELRLGPSLAFSRLDEGAAMYRGLHAGGFIGVDFHSWFSCLRGARGCTGLSILWTALDYRSHIGGRGFDGGGGEAGAGMIGRSAIGNDGSYFQLWLGYFLVFDSQASYPAGDDMLAMWHFAYLRTRVQLGSVFSAELGGGLSDSNQTVHVALRAQLSSNFALGVETNGYFNNGESKSMDYTVLNQRWGRELWVTRAYLAYDLGDGTF